MPTDTGSLATARVGGLHPHISHGQWWRRLRLTELFAACWPGVHWRRRCDRVRQYAFAVSERIFDTPTLLLVQAEKVIG